MRGAARMRQFSLHRFCQAVYRPLRIGSRQYDLLLDSALQVLKCGPERDFSGKNSARRRADQIGYAPPPETAETEAVRTIETKSARISDIPWLVSLFRSV